jgi:hypothetical protein
VGWGLGAGNLGGFYFISYFVAFPREVVTLRQSERLGPGICVCTAYLLFARGGWGKSSNQGPVEEWRGCPDPGARSMLRESLFGADVSLRVWVGSRVTLRPLFGGPCNRSMFR